MNVFKTLQIVICSLKKRTNLIPEHMFANTRDSLYITVYKQMIGLTARQEENTFFFFNSARKPFEAPKRHC